MQNYKTKNLAAYLIVVWLLIGCTTTLPQSNIIPPANLMQVCGALNELTGTTGADVLRNITENAVIYHDCADKHKSLIDAIK